MPVLKLKTGIELYYDEWGSGDNVLLSARNFPSKISYYTIDLASRGFHVYNIQLRGYGKSSPVTEEFGEKWYDVWAKDICDFADALGIDRFVYSGQSHGAGVGWMIAYRYPERLKAFIGVVAGPHTRDGKETGRSRLDTIEAAASPEKWKAYCDKRIGRMTVMAEACTDPKEKAKRLAMAEEAKDDWYNMKPATAMIDPHKPFAWCKTEEAIIEVLKTIKTPTLLLGGMHDDVSRPEDLLRSCRAVPDSKLVLYEAAGHGLSAQKKRDMLEDIVSWSRLRGLIK